MNFLKDPRSSADNTFWGGVQDCMISLKRYLDRENHPAASHTIEHPSCEKLLSAYCASLVEMGECGVEACPPLGPELVRSFERITESLGQAATADRIADSEIAVRDLLKKWGKRVSLHYEQKATDVKDLLLVLSRTAESFCHKDDRFAHDLDSVTAQLASIASLDDVTRMRASIESSARELKRSAERMAAEGNALIEHLRVEVSTYEAKLERAEYVASRDALTGLGSRHWVEARMQERISSGTSFSIVLVDIDEFGRLVEDYGNLVGDLLLKEFARELRSGCRMTDIVGRWGSDEFVIVLDSGGPEVQLSLSRLCAWISKPYHVPGRTGYVNVQLNASLGVADYRDGEDIQTLLEQADLELCRVKGAGAQRKTA
jgi:diguanylate cyclase (GGDEF)-like protein